MDVEAIAAELQRPQGFVLAAGWSFDAAGQRFEEIVLALEAAGHAGTFKQVARFTLRGAGGGVLKVLTPSARREGLQPTLRV